MTQFAQKSFTVPQRGRDAATCGHGWRDPRGRCVFCGVKPSDGAARDKARRRRMRKMGFNPDDIADVLRYEYEGEP
jgi:hypothetical protein